MPPVEVPEEIVCVDCGGPCYRLSFVPEDGFTPGDVVAYRCRDCHDRWDLVIDEDNTGAEQP